MTFTATHTRAFVGCDLTVGVTAGDKESIASVVVTFDGELLEELELADGTDSYSRAFAHVGSAGSGMEHTLVVTATDAAAAPHSATTRWSDS